MYQNQQKFAERLLHRSILKNYSKYSNEMYTKERTIYKDELNEREAELDSNNKRNCCTKSSFLYIKFPITKSQSILWM